MPRTPGDYEKASAIPLRREWCTTLPEQEGCWVGLLPMTHLPDYDATVLTLLGLDIAPPPRMCGRGRCM